MEICVALILCLLLRILSLFFFKQTLLVPQQVMKKMNTSKHSGSKIFLITTVPATWNGQIFH